MIYDKVDYSCEISSLEITNKEDIYSFADIIYYKIEASPEC
jgi:hypothetical protein